MPTKLKGFLHLKVFGNLKTDNIMAKIKLAFLGSEKSESEDHELQCYANSSKEIYLSIDDGNCPPSYICLDVPTAIKLAKVLRNEINTIKEG